MSSSLENQIFNLKFTSKQFLRQSKKYKKNETVQTLQLRKVLEQGDTEGARIHAQHAIRERSLALEYQQLSDRIDAVALRIETAVQMGIVRKSMLTIVRQFDKVLRTMDLQKITRFLDQIEIHHEPCDVQSGYADHSTPLTKPVDEVELLIEQVAEEYDFDFSEPLRAIPVPTEDIALTKRLAELKTKASVNYHVCN